LARLSGLRRAGRASSGFIISAAVMRGLSAEGQGQVNVKLENGAPPLL
jgi:hypothetical protein